MLMAYEITRDLELEDTMVETPVVTAKAKTLSGKKLGVVPILRAGLGMVEGVVNMIPAAKVGHIGMYRDETTFEPVEYFIKMPSDISERTLIVVDPMLATGGSAILAMDALKNVVQLILNLCVWLRLLKVLKLYKKNIQM